MTDDPRPMDNGPLKDAMTRMARSGKDMYIRKQLYMALLRAEFLVPLSTAAPESLAELEVTHLYTDGELGGQPTFQVFSEQRLYDKKHRNTPSLRLLGGFIFTVMARGKAGSVRINPGGRVGGELYGHEIQMLAEAAPRVAGSLGIA